MSTNILYVTQTTGSWSKACAIADTSQDVLVTGGRADNIGGCSGFSSGSLGHRALIPSALWVYAEMTRILGI